MKTQLWIADCIPEMIPDWVNPSITVDFDSNYKRYYIFEIDPDDEIFSRCKTPDNKATRILKVCGFVKPRKIYQGLAEEFFLNEYNSYPPQLSQLLKV